MLNYKTKNGDNPRHTPAAADIILIDPAVNTAKELYEHLEKQNLFNPSGNIKDSEFYISVPNKYNKNIKTDNEGRFTYEYKYGRNVNEIQEYVKVVPFSRNNISGDILTRFQQQIPHVYQLMQNFNQQNSKTKSIKLKDKI